MTATDDTTQDDDATAVQSDPVAQELLAAQAELGKMKDLAARAQADLQNAKERLDRQAGDIRTYALEGALTRLLPTIDNFQRAIAHLPDELKDHDWVQGIVATEHELMKQVNAMGLKKLESLGQKIDAHKHEVLQAGAGEIDTVTEVFEDGYELNGKVIRVAKVKVGDGTPT